VRGAPKNGAKPAGGRRNGGNGHGRPNGNGDGAAVSPPKTQGFPHGDHLAGMDFLRVMAKGEKRSCPSFHLYYMSADQFQAGVCVSRRLGGAVVRNWIKRVLREAIRLTRSDLCRPCHVVLVARLGADRLDLVQAQSSLSELYTAARLLAIETTTTPVMS